MQNIIDKRDRAKLLRERLSRAMEETQTTQSGLARKIGVDRSTISQLLTDQGARLPNAQVIAECAQALNISADWLLGLSDRSESATDLLENAFHLTQATRALVDEQIFEWHQEAAGYKIRHVPAKLPDMVKTDAMLRWEYEPYLGKTAEQAIAATRDRLNWMRGTSSDFEIALPRDELTNFIHGHGYYADLPKDIRMAQIDRIREMFDQLYPRVRVYLFDARVLYSSPVTVFGPLLATVYVGSSYLVFRDSRRVQAISDHFDQLVRAATVTSRDLSEFLDQA